MGRESKAGAEKINTALSFRALAGTFSALAEGSRELRKSVERLGAGLRGEAPVADKSPKGNTP